MLTAELEPIYHELCKEIASKRVVLLHPNSTYRGFLLAQLVNDEAIQSVYFNLQDTTSLQSFIEGFTRKLLELSSFCGQHLKAIAPSIYNANSYEQHELFEAFIRELTEFSDTPYLIILDEYDYVDSSDSLNTFIEQIIPQLPAHVSLLISSRTMPRLSWLSLVALNAASLFRDGNLIIHNLYHNLKESPANIKANAFGQGTVFIDGKQIETWEGHLPRLILFYVLDKPRVTRTEICRDFWPEAEGEQAVNVFHVTKRRLHKALNMDVLSHDGDYYSLSPQLSLYHDVMDFVERLAEARNLSSSPAIETWQAAKDVYRGQFLQGHHEAWILNKRKAFSHGYIEALTSLAQLWMIRERPEVALKLYQQAIEEDYARQDMHRQILSIYRLMGRRAEALEHCQNLERIYAIRKIKLEDATKLLMSHIIEMSTP